MIGYLQIQNEAYYLQLAAKDALLNALLLAAKRFTSGPPQVPPIPFRFTTKSCHCHCLVIYL